jgi:ABC-type amino acid transport substrate-binding protein
LGDEFSIGEGYGIIARLGRTDLIAEINKALLAIESDDTYLNTYRAFFN